MLTRLAGIATPTPKMEITVLLPKNRTQLGTLTATHDGRELGSYAVYGKSDNATAKAKGNADRDPLKPFGDTPTGHWKVTVGNKHADTHTYGTEPVFMLWPLDGQALASHGPRYRRTGIWLHGGGLNAAGGLRPTFGCLRVHNETMAKLHTFIRQLGPISTFVTKEI